MRKCERIIDTHITDTQTGRSGTHRWIVGIHYTSDTVLWNWSTGNDSCDCNRAMNLARALCEDVPDDAPCNNRDNRYRVDWINLNGERLITGDPAKSC